MSYQLMVVSCSSVAKVQTISVLVPPEIAITAVVAISAAVRRSKHFAGESNGTIIVVESRLPEQVSHASTVLAVACTFPIRCKLTVRGQPIIEIPNFRGQAAKAAHRFGSEAFWCDNGLLFGLGVRNDNPISSF